MFLVAVVWANTVECVTGQFLLSGVHNTEPGSSEGVSPSGWITWGGGTLYHVGQVVTFSTVAMVQRHCADGHVARGHVAVTVIAKFHYTSPTGPARTFLHPGSPRNSVGSVRVSDKVRAGPRGSGRARVVECSLNTIVVPCVRYTLFPQTAAVAS